MFMIISLFIIVLAYIFRNEKDINKQVITPNENVKKSNCGLWQSFWFWLWKSDSALKFTDDEIYSCVYGRGCGKINE